MPAHLFLWGQKLGREIQPAAAFDEPCSALIVHLAWRTRMARRCGGRGRIRGARAGEPTCTLAVPAAPVGEKGSGCCRAGTSTAGQLGTMTHLVISSVHCCVPRRQLLPHLPCAAKSVGWSGKGCGWLATISAVDGQQCGLRPGAEDKEKACAPATGIHIKLIQLGLSRAEAHALASGDDDMTPLQYRRGTRATDVCKRVVGSFA